MSRYSAESAAAGRATRTRIKRERIANLCDLVAEGVTIKAASKLIGVTPQTGTAMMAEVRRELGWQAC